MDTREKYPGAHGAEWVVVAAAILAATVLGYGVNLLLNLG